MIRLWSYLVLVSIYSISFIGCSSFSFSLLNPPVLRSLFSYRPEPTILPNQNGFTFLAIAQSKNQVHITSGELGLPRSLFVSCGLSPAWTTISPLSPICSLSCIQVVTAWSSIMIYQTYVGVPPLVSQPSLHLVSFFIFPTRYPYTLRGWKGKRHLYCKTHAVSILHRASWVQFTYRQKNSVQAYNTPASVIIIAPFFLSHISLFLCSFPGYLTFLRVYCHSNGSWLRYFILTALHGIEGKQSS